MNLSFLHTILLVALFFPTVSKICGFEPGPMLSVHFSTFWWRENGKQCSLNCIIVFSNRAWMHAEYLGVHTRFRNHFEAWNQSHQYNNLTVLIPLGNKKCFFLESLSITKKQGHSNLSNTGILAQEHLCPHIYSWYIYLFKNMNIH